MQDSKRSFLSSEQQIQTATEQQIQTAAQQNCDITPESYTEKNKSVQEWMSSLKIKVAESE